MRSRFDRFSWLPVAVLFALVLTLPTLATAQTRGNPICAGEDVFFNPGNGENIVVPPGFAVSVFKSGLNFPTAVAFRGDRHRFERSEEHTSELQSLTNLVCRLLLEKK